MSNSIWDFVFKFAADASGIQDGFNKADRAADQLEGTLNIVDQAAQHTNDVLRSVGSELVSAVRESSGLGDELVGAASNTRALNSQLTATERVAESVKQQFRGWGNEILGIATGALAISSLIGSVTEVTRFSLEMGTLAQRAGLAVETFGALTQEARNLGGEFTESEIFSAIERLQTETDDVYGTLERFQRLARNMSSTQAIKLGDSLGIDAVLVNVLQNADLTLEQLTQRYVRLGGLTDDQLIKLRASYVAWQQLRQSYQSVIRLVLVGIVPALSTVSELLQGTVGFLSENSDAVSAFFITAAAIILTVYLPAISAAVAATLALVAPFLPLILIIGAVGTAVALLYDDYRTFERGGRSVIGRLVEQWPPLLDIINAVRSAVGGVGDALFSLEDLATTLIRDGVTGVFRLLADTVSDVYQRLAEAFPAVGPILNAMGELSSTIYTVMQSIVGAIFATAMALVRFIFNVLSAVVTLFTDPRQAFQDLKATFGTLFDDLLGVFPTITNAFNAMRTLATSVIDSIMERFGGIQRFVAWLRGESESNEAYQSITAPSTATGYNELVPPDESGNSLSGTLGRSLSTAGDGMTSNPTETSVPDNSTVPQLASLGEPEVITVMHEMGNAVAMANESLVEVNEVANTTNTALTENSFATNNINASRTTDVRIDRIEINTQATNAEDMKRDVRDAIAQVFSDIETDSQTGIV